MSKNVTLPTLIAANHDAISIDVGLLYTTAIESLDPGVNLPEDYTYDTFVEHSSLVTTIQQTMHALAIDGITTHLDANRNGNDLTQLSIKPCQYTPDTCGVFEVIGNTLVVGTEITNVAVLEASMIRTHRLNTGLALLEDGSDV